MVHLLYPLTLFIIALLPHISSGFSARNPTCAIVSRSHLKFEFPGVDIPSLFDSQNRTFDALFDMGEDSTSLLKSMAESERAVSTLAQITRTSSVTGREETATLLDDIVLGMQDARNLLVTLVAHIEFSASIVLTLYDKALSALRRLEGVQHIEIAESTPSKRKKVEALTAGVSEELFQLFDSMVITYEDVYTGAATFYGLEVAAVAVLRSRMQFLQTALFSRYPAHFGGIADVDVFAALVSILREERADVSAVDEQTLQEIVSWTEKLAVGVKGTLQALEWAERDVEAIRAGMLRGVRVPFAEQIERMQLGVALLQTARNRVAVPGREVFVKKLKAVFSGPAVEGGGVQQTVL